MTNWDYYFNKSYPFEDPHHEVFSDTGYSLGINTLLFAILVQHIEDDYIDFSIDDFTNIGAKFINVGCARVVWAFSREELYDFLHRFSSEDDSNCFTNLGNGNYRANMKVILGDLEFSEQEKSFFQNDLRELRKFALFCSLQLSIDTTYKPINYALCLQNFS